MKMFLLWAPFMMWFAASHANEVTLAEVNKLLDESKFQVALELTDQLLQQNPNDQYALLARSRGLLSLRRFDEALLILDGLQISLAESPLVPGYMALAHRGLNQPDKAIAVIRDAIVQFPESGPLYEQLGDILSLMAADAFALAATKSDNNKRLLLKSRLSLNLNSEARKRLIGSHLEKTKSLASKPESQRIVNTLHSWARAWNQRDIEAYLSHYSKGFKPENNRTMESWRQRRKASFTQSEYIRVGMDKMDLSILDRDTVSVRFREVFESNLHDSISHKELILKKIQGVWLIDREHLVDQ